MQTLTAHVSDIASVACTILGAFGGLWAVAYRLRLLLRAEIQDFAASKEHVARVEEKVDIVLAALVGWRSRKVQTP